MPRVMNGHEEDFSGCSPAFKQLLFGLSQQYERDLAEALREAAKKAGQNLKVIEVKDPFTSDDHTFGDTMISLRPADKVLDSNPSTDVNPDGSTHPLRGMQVDRVSEVTIIASEDSNKNLVRSTSSSNNAAPSPAGATQARHSRVSLAWEPMRAMASLESRHSVDFKSATKAAAQQLDIEEGLRSKRDTFLRIEDRLSNDSALDKIIKSVKFEQFCGFFLLLYAIFVGVEVNQLYHVGPAPEILIIDYMFCIVFVVELSLRLKAYGCREFWTNREERAWNIFDAIVVLLTVADSIVSIVFGGAVTHFLGGTLVLRVGRILKLARVLRIIRIMKMFRDLRILLGAIATTVKTASFAFVLISIIMYIFSIALTQLVAEKKTSSAEGRQGDLKIGSVLRGA
eukprot:TRINITY_DN32027_c0_g1_i2.p1 TRINITY_DN32027_c0_g1~~TRINITY_DN32027_c0_g1_i2.p1  ORF type:complete len:398 (-),score=57.39 TRINITY_DN32027_c0_g1_i2:217-1410(-)